MTIGELMNRCVVECTEDTSIEEAYELFERCGHRILVVVDSLAHRRPIGVVTDRSICEQVIGRGRNPRTLAAGSAMDSRILKVREAESLESISLTEVERAAAIIVVNDRRQACGVLARESVIDVAHSFATTHSTGRIAVSTSMKASPASIEIPVFGWIQ